MKELRQQPGWAELEAHLRAQINRKQAGRDSLNENDPPEKFVAHKERSSYMTGWIQGASYVLLDVEASVAEEPNVRAQIKELEASIKASKKV